MACISPESKFIAVGTFMSDVKLWAFKYSMVSGDPSTAVFGGLEESPFTHLKGHVSGVNSVSFLSDGKRVVTCSKDSTWKLWNINVNYQHDQQPTVLTSCQNPDKGEQYTHHAVSPNMQVLAVVSKRNIQLWDLTKTTLVETISDVHRGNITQLAWSYDSKLVASACSDSSIRVFKNPL